MYKSYRYYIFRIVFIKLYVLSNNRRRQFVPQYVSLMKRNVDSDGLKKTLINYRLFLLR